MENYATTEDQRTLAVIKANFFLDVIKLIKYQRKENYIVHQW